MTTNTPTDSHGTTLDLPDGVVVHPPCPAGSASILTRDALAFVADLERHFRAERDACLAARVVVQDRLDAGGSLDFLAATADVRAGSWRVGPIPSDLADRTVEITGPVDRKMIINALNSGADVFMADFEDSNAPTWQNTIEGQINLRDAVRREIELEHPSTGRRYTLAARTATLMVRPRGWHLVEKHLEVDGRPVVAGLFDFGLFLFHNAGELVRRGSGPYFYLPKLECHREARLWNDVFLRAQRRLGLATGTIKATVLIETITAAFEMEEILYELREHSAGLNCGRWDYIFSFIKRFRAHADHVLPDRASVGMDRHFLRSYSELLIQTCHRRGAQAMGGMAAQIPIKNDPERHEQAMASVRADKKREAEAGHDGTWVAHPGLVAIAREQFEAVGPAARRLTVMRDDVDVSASDLLAVPAGAITEAGLRQNLDVGIRYLEAWLRGSGCVPIHGLMEDAATAEISRTQVWQWLRHGARIAGTRLPEARRPEDRRPEDRRPEDRRPEDRVAEDRGPEDRVAGDRVLDRELFRAVLDQEMAAIQASVGDVPFGNGRFALAKELFTALIESDELPEFLTIAAYDHI